MCARGILESVLSAFRLAFLRGQSACRVFRVCIRLFIFGLACALWCLWPVLHSGGGMTVRVCVCGGSRLASESGPRYVDIVACFVVA